MQNLVALAAIAGA